MTTHLWARDLTGQQFGRLTVLFRVPDRKCPRWKCHCECGREPVVRSHALTRRHQQSCGCIRVERAKVRMTLHGHTSRRHGYSPTYSSWISMKARCNNPKHIAYRFYGARGVSVCDRWQSFVAFLADMGERPTGTSIDRIDNSKGYEPGNCRWATQAEQSANRRPKRKPCAVSGCVRLAESRGYCGTHYERFRLGMDIGAPIRKRSPNRRAQA